MRKRLTLFTEDGTELIAGLPADEIVDLIYPVGAVYISVVNINPETLWGGEWESIGKGRTLVGVDTTDNDFNAVEKIGGIKNSPHTHALTNHVHSQAHTHNMPHTHNSAAHTHTVGDHYHSLDANGFAQIGVRVGGNSLGYNFGNTTFTSRQCGAFQTPEVVASIHATPLFGRTAAMTAAANTGSTTPGVTGAVNTAATAGVNTANTGDPTTLPATGSSSNDNISSNLQPYITVFIWKRVA